MKHNTQTDSILTDRFGKDSLIALATVEDGIPRVLLPENKAVMDILRKAFAAWYANGHTNEADPNTCLLKIKLTDSVLFADGVRYDIDFT